MAHAKTADAPHPGELRPDVELVLPSSHPDARRVRYLVSDLLGTGSFSSCYAAQRVEWPHAIGASSTGAEAPSKADPPEDEWVAIKVVPLFPDGKPTAGRATAASPASIRRHAKEAFDNEVQALQRALQQPSIVQLKAAFRDREHAYIVLEYCDGGTLGDLLRKRLKTPQPFFSEERVRDYGRQLLQSLAFLHRECIVHRDVKPDNIFLTQDGTRIKLADFGMCAHLASADQRLHEIMGTPTFMAPEVMYPDVTQQRGYGFAADVFSAGAVLYTLLTGRYVFLRDSRDSLEWSKTSLEFEAVALAPDEGDGAPPVSDAVRKAYQAERQKRLYARLHKCRVRFPKDVPLSHRAKEMLRGLLTRDPDARWTIEHALQQPFFTHRLDQPVERAATVGIAPTNSAVVVPTPDPAAAAAAPAQSTMTDASTAALV